MAPKAAPKRKGAAAPAEEPPLKKKKGGAQPGAGRPKALLQAATTIGSTPSIASLAVACQEVVVTVTGKSHF